VARTKNIDKIQVAPPTKKQVQDVVYRLRTGTFLEHAALLSGISTRILARWIELGRKRTPGFVEFTDAIDVANAELGDKITRAINAAAEDGDQSALKWLYEKRLGEREKHLQKKWLKSEDDGELATAGDEDIVSLEDAEKRLEESLLAADDAELH
jgi:hypothetical protein